MKKLVFMLLLSVLFVGLKESTAQTEKGNLMLGTQLGNITGNFGKNSNTFDFNVNPSFAYFIKNNLAIGAMLDLGLSTGKDKSTVFTYGLGPWARYYFPFPEELRFSQHAAFFLDGFAGFQGFSQNHGGSTNGLGINVGPGMSYFLTPNIALDATLKYNLILGFGSATTQNRVGLNIGFQIFIPRNDLKEKYDRGGF